MNVFVPARPFPPGEYLQEEIDARGWTIDDLVEITGISRRQVFNVLQAKSGVTPESAKAFAEAFGQDAQTWMNLQAAYELANIAQEDREIARKAKMFNKVPVRELKRRGWLANTDDTNKLELAICALLGIKSIDDEPNLSVAARKGTPYDADTAAQVAWYCRCAKLAEGVAAARYSDSNWQPGVEKLLLLAANEPDIRVVPKTLAEMGIRLVLVQSLKHTKIDGVALWLDSQKPVIALSLRYDRIDNFWFTLMHEMMHIRYRDQSPVDVDVYEVCDDLPEIEKRANSGASNFLIPDDKLTSFINRMHPHYYQTRVVQFAQARAVHPGIVVGQLHRRGKLKYSQLRKLLVKVREHIIGSALTDGWQNALNDE